MQANKPTPPDTARGETPAATDEPKPAETADVPKPSAVPRPKFSGELLALTAQFDNRSVCLGDLLHATSRVSSHWPAVDSHPPRL